MTGPQCAHPEAERQDALALVRTALDKADAVARRVGDELLDEARLAEPRLAENRDHARAAFGASVDLGAHARELRAAADQGRVNNGFTRRTGEPRPASRRRPLGRALGQDFAVELLGLGLGLDPQLAPQRLHADLVAPQRGRAAALGRVEPHERPMRGFLKRIEGDEPQGRLDGPLRLSVGSLAGQQRVQHAKAELAEPFALSVEPGLEGGILHDQPGEEISPVERRRVLERGQGVLRGQTLEFEHVDAERGGVQGHALMIDHEGRFPGATEHPAKLEQGLAQTVSRLLVRPVSPAERRQACPRLRAIGGQREVSEEGLRLLRQRQRTVVEAGPESAEKTKA